MSKVSNVLVVLSGPSGVGKGTIADIIKKSMNMALSISCTTRLPREKEEHGKHYFFISKEQFSEKIEQNGFLEYSSHFENFYGTPKDFVLDKLKTQDVILEIDVNGGLNVKKNFPSAVLIMILPPSLQELESRLKNRNTETEEQIKTRLKRISYELDKKDLYDYVVVNDKLEKAVEDVENIIKLEKNKEK